MRNHSQADLRQAAGYYQAAFLIAPAKDPDYASRAARALMSIPDADGAVRAELSTAIGANPNDPMGYLTRARYNVERHPENQADIRQDFEHALELNPNDIDSRIEFAKVLETFGDHEGAAGSIARRWRRMTGLTQPNPSDCPPPKWTRSSRN